MDESKKDSRLDEIKKNLNIEGEVDTPEEAMAVIDGQMGFDEYLEEVSADAKTEKEKVEIKKQTKEKLLVTAGFGKNVIRKSVETVMHESMMPYSEHVILDRAMPRVEDGLKPVQRRILYSMLELGVTPDKPYRKSARIVGDTMGKYHPHGDSAIYGALVRLAQPFNMNACLVDGHGNFGSVDGDGAAAMRYTEARMAPLALEMLRDLEKDTVEWQFNFDDSLKEPITLPSRFPNLLVNGTTGIAVGLATNIPPHNLGEVISGVVAYIDNNKISLKEMMKHIKAPDFPTGGYIIAGEELVKAYETGKGKIYLRAKVHIENGENEKKNIVITELPYQVNKASLLTKIMELRDSKKDKLGMIQEICDESDRNGMRAVIRVKKDGNVDDILATLFKYTDLQTSFGMNMVAIANGRPQLLGLLDMIKYYVDYQQSIIYRRTKFDLNNAKEREHILEGLVIAVRNIDEVIKIIKTSENTGVARKRLQERFKLSERQAQAILDMRLARLTSLEIFKLENELKELKELIKRLTEIVNSKKLQLELVKTELLEIRKKFKVSRLSAVLGTEADFEIKNIDDARPIENIVIGLTAGGTVKSFTAKHFGACSKETSEKTTAFDIHTKLISTSTEKTIMFFTNLGNAFKMIAGDIPDCKWKDKGTPFKTIFSEALSDEYPVAVFEVPENMESNLIFFSRAGMIKKTAWKEYGLLKNYFQAAKFKDDDRLVDVQPENTDPKCTLLFVTKAGMTLNAFNNDVPLQGRISGGVKGIQLADKDEVVLITQAMPKTEIVLVTNKGFAKKVKINEIEPMARYRKGVKIIDFGKENGNEIVFASLVSDKKDIVLKNSENEPICISTANLEIQPRVSKGKSIFKAKNNMDINFGYTFETKV